jgi:glycosyltransferase involved in cell wall biosynthesis
MAVRLASHLAREHDVALMCPIVKHYTANHKLRPTSWLSKIRYIIRELYRYKSEFFFEDDLDNNVKLKTYLLVPSESVLKKFDAIIYSSVWQYHELKPLPLKGIRKIYWSLADHLFCNPTGFSINSILEAYSSSDFLVAASQVTQADLRRYGFNAQVVIPGGIDPIFNDKGRTWNVESPTVLGYFQPEWWVKGAATLVQCLRQLRTKYPEVRIELFGHTNSDIERTGSLICDRFYSGLSSKQVANLCRANDIFVYPSYSDGFGYPPLEAMACGCAVVATRVGAVPEYARHKHNALLCDAMDDEGMFQQVEQLILDSELRMRLSHNAAKDAPCWTWEYCCEQFDMLLRGLV